MPTSIFVDRRLRNYTNGEAQVHATGMTLGALLDDLEKRYPGLKRAVCSPDGLRVRSGLSVLANGEPISKLEAAVPENSRVDFVEPRSGG